MSQSWRSHLPVSKMNSLILAASLGLSGKRLSQLAYLSEELSFREKKHDYLYLFFYVWMLEKWIEIVFISN